MVVTVQKHRLSVKLDENSSIGDRVKERRLELKLRQFDAAKLIGITEDALRFWET